MDEWLFWEQYSHEPYVAVARFQMVYLGKKLHEREARIVAALHHPAIVRIFDESPKSRISR